MSPCTGVGRKWPVPRANAINDSQTVLLLRTAKSPASWQYVEVTLTLAQVCNFSERTVRHSECYSRSCMFVFNIVSKLGERPSPPPPLPPAAAVVRIVIYNLASPASRSSILKIYCKCYARMRLKGRAFDNLLPLISRSAESAAAAAVIHHGHVHSVFKTFAFDRKKRIPSRAETGVASFNLWFSAVPCFLLSEKNEKLQSQHL